MTELIIIVEGAEGPGLPFGENAQHNDHCWLNLRGSMWAIGMRKGEFFLFWRALEGGAVEAMPMIITDLNVAGYADRASAGLQASIATVDHLKRLADL
jgi:hypothetical protein